MAKLTQHERVVEHATNAGGWGGANAAAKGGGAVGAPIGPVFGRIAAPIGAGIGGLVAGVGGYFTGE